MITGETKNQIDRIWGAFWSGGISNPLESRARVMAAFAPRSEEGVAGGETFILAFLE